MPAERRRPTLKAEWRAPPGTRRAVTSISPIEPSARVPDVVVAEQWFSNVEIEREVRPLARFNDRLSAFARDPLR